MKKQRKTVRLKANNVRPIYVPSVGRVAPGDPFELPESRHTEYLLSSGLAVANKGGRPKRTPEHGGVDV